MTGSPGKRYNTAMIRLLDQKTIKTAGLLAGPLLFLAFLLLPLPLAPRAQIVAGILAWVVVYWFSEAIPLAATALMGVVLCVALGAADAREAFAPFADPTIFLFLGSFLLAKGLEVHGLDRRIAYRIVSSRWVGDDPVRLLLAYGAVTAFISMWISNTAAAAMMLPVGLGLIRALQDESQDSGAHDRFAVGILLMTALGASVGGIGTPVGTPPNVIGIAMIENLAGVRIPFFQWMLFAVPLLVVMFLLLFGILLRFHGPGTLTVDVVKLREKRIGLGPLSPGERNVLAAFGVAVALWIVPGVLALLWGADSPLVGAFGRRFPEAAAAMIGALLLFVLPKDLQRMEPSLTWEQALEIDWGTLLLFGGGLSLGSLMFQSGLAESVGRGILAVSGADSCWGIAFAAILVSILASEVTSNTATANMVVPVVISLCVAAGVNPVPPALGATLGASWGFMLPVSTPPNAIVFGSGLVPLRAMLRVGWVFDLVGCLVLWAGLRILLPLVGLA